MVQYVFQLSSNEMVVEGIHTSVLALTEIVDVCHVYCGMIKGKQYRRLYFEGCVRLFYPGRDLQ